MPKTRKKRVAPGPPPAGRKPAGKPRSVAVRAGTKQRAPAKPRWQRDRAGKEQQLLKAFDRLLQEQGAHRLRVNAIVKEAGVGKNLLYAYFGGIEGLAKAWAEAADFLPSDAEIRGTDLPAYAAMTTAAQLTSNYRHFAAALRRRPHTLEILAGELLQQTDVTRALDHVREDYGKGLRRFFTRPDEYDRENATALQLILYAAVIYLAQRSRTSPRYFGLRLDEAAGWQTIDEAIGLVVRGVMGPDETRRSPKRAARTGGRRRKKSAGPGI